MKISQRALPPFVLLAGHGHASPECGRRKISTFRQMTPAHMGGVGGRSADWELQAKAVITVGC